MASARTATWARVSVRRSTLARRAKRWATAATSRDALRSATGPTYATERRTAQTRNKDYLSGTLWVCVLSVFGCVWRYIALGFNL